MSASGGLDDIELHEHWCRAQSHIECCGPGECDCLAARWQALLDRAEAALRAQDADSPYLPTDEEIDAARAVLRGEFGFDVARSMVAIALQAARSATIPKLEEPS